MYFSVSSAVLQEAVKQVEKLLPDGLDYLLNNAGTSEDIEPPLDTCVAILRTDQLQHISIAKAFLLQYMHEHAQPDFYTLRTQVANMQFGHAY